MSRLLCSLYWIEVEGDHESIRQSTAKTSCSLAFLYIPSSVSPLGIHLLRKETPFFFLPQPILPCPTKGKKEKRKKKRYTTTKKNRGSFFFIFLFFHQIVPWNCCKDDTKEIEETTFLRAFDEQQTTVVAHSELSFLLCLDSYNNPFNFKYVRSPRTTFCDPFLTWKKKRIFSTH